MKLFYSFFFLSLLFQSRAAFAEDIESAVNLDFTKCAMKSATQKSFTYDKGCIQKFYDNHPFTNTSFSDWQNAAKKPVNERIITLTQEAKEYLILDGLLWGFPYEKVAGASDPDLLKDAQTALRELPPELLKYIEDRFYGFLIVSGVGWTGYSPVINENPASSLKRGSVIIINADNIQGRNLNEWLAFKEKTAFDFFNEDGSSAKYDVKMNFSIPGTKSTLADNLKQFLIHEAAHILAIGVQSIHPSFEVRDKVVPAKEFETVWPDGSSGFPFLQTTWEKELVDSSLSAEPAYKMIALLPDSVKKILAQKPVKYYGTDAKKKFTPSEAEALYKNLNNSCFASLYSTVDYTEDFAETVTQYFMTYRDQYRFSVEFSKLNASGKSKALAKFESPIWNRQECQYKLEYMKTLFGH